MYKNAHSTPLNVCEMVYDGVNKTRVPESMGYPHADQLLGGDVDNLVEIAGRVCYDGQTELLTESGWVKLPELLATRRGEPVATYNRITGMMEYQEPTDYIERTYTGRMYTVNTTKVSMRVTEDHELWVMPPRKTEFILARADQMAGKTYRLKRHARYEGVPCEGLSLPPHRYTQRKNNGHWKVNGHSVATMARQTPGLELSVDRMQAWAAFLGYYFSEGCLNKPAGNCGRRITIYQLPETSAPIRDSIERLGLRFTTYCDKRNGVLRFNVSSGPIARYLDAFGRVAAVKRLPRECLQWPAAMRETLLDALFFGDGHVTKCGVRVYSTRSPFLADDVQELIIKSGRVGTISYTPVGDMYRIRESQHDLHAVNRHGQKDSLDEVSGEKTYCVSVPNRILVTRRDRKVVLCGNCYDSLGAFDKNGKRLGRSSQDYHAHINETRHHSTHEHAAVTVEMAVIDSQDYAVLLESIVGRPGLHFERHEAGASRAPGSILTRLTMNLRTIREWGNWSAPGTHDNPMSNLMRIALSRIAMQVAPMACSDLAGAASSDLPEHVFSPVRLVKPQSDQEIWASLYFENVSRGLTHELVRHGDMTAISQRSTRFVDENESDWVPHPLILRDQESLDLFNKAREFCNPIYAQIVQRQMEKLKAGGVEPGVARKQSRGAARGVLGNALETQLIFSAALSQWKWIIRKRCSHAADQEIRCAFANVLKVLKASFPVQFADEAWDLLPARDGIGTVVRCED